MKIKLNNLQKKISIGTNCKTKVNALIGITKDQDSNNETDYFKAFERMNNS